MLKISNTGENWSGIRFCDAGAPTTQNFDILYNSSIQDLKIRSDDTDNIMYFEYDTGHIGIGTTPTCTLHIKSATPVLLIDNDSFAQNDIKFQSNRGEANIISDLSWFNTDTTNVEIARIRIKKSSSADGNGEIQFHTANGTTLSQRMTIDSAGNVGINNNSPSYPLDVVGHINSSTSFRISGTSVLGATTLGTGVVNSSLTSVGTLTSLTSTGKIYNGGTGNIGDFQTNNLDASTVLVETPWVYARAIESQNEKGSAGTALVFGTGKYDNQGDNIALITQGNTNLLVNNSNNVVITNDLTVGGDLGITGDLNINGIFSANEVQATVCSSLGCLGMILLDQKSTGALSPSNFTDFKLNCDNQSTSLFQQYKVIFRGDTTGSASQPQVLFRWFDSVVGEIGGTNSYTSRVTYFNGGSSVTGRGLQGYIYRNTGTTSISDFFSGHFTMTLNQTRHFNRIVGQYSHSSANGAVENGYNFHSALTNLAPNLTKIVSMGFGVSGTSGPSTFVARIYRML